MCRFVQIADISRIWEEYFRQLLKRRDLVTRWILFRNYLQVIYVICRGIALLKRFKSTWIGMKNENSVDVSERRHVALHLSINRHISGLLQGICLTWREDVTRLTRVIGFKFLVSAGQTYKHPSLAIFILETTLGITFEGCMFQ